MSNKQKNEVYCYGDEYSHHPLVYLYVKPGEKIVCPYCSKEFYGQEE